MRRRQIGRSLSSKSWAKEAGALCPGAEIQYWVRKELPPIEQFLEAKWKEECSPPPVLPRVRGNSALIQVPFLWMVGGSSCLFLLGL